MCEHYIFIQLHETFLQTHTYSYHFIFTKNHLTNSHTLRMTTKTHISTNNFKITRLQMPPMKYILPTPSLFLSLSLSFSLSLSPSLFLVHYPFLSGYVDMLVEGNPEICMKREIGVRDRESVCKWKKIEKCLSVRVPKCTNTQKNKICISATERNLEALT